MFDLNHLDDMSTMMVSTDINFGDNVDFRSYTNMLRASTNLSRRVSDMVHLQEQMMSVQTMVDAMESGNLTKYVLQAADPHGVLTTSLGIAPTSLGDIPLHKKDKRAALFIQGLEAIASPTVGGALTDSLSGAIQKLSEMFDYTKRCVVDLSAKAERVTASVDAMVEQDRMHLHMEAPDADESYRTMSDLASVTIPMPSLSANDLHTLHSSVNAVGHLIPLSVLGNTVVPDMSADGGSPRVGTGSLASLGYTKTNTSGIVTKTKEVLENIRSIVSQKDAIVARLVELQGKASSDPEMVSRAIGWMACYAEMMSGMITYASDSLTVAESVATGEGVPAVVEPTIDENGQVVPTAPVQPTAPAAPPVIDDTPVEPEVSLRF